VKEFDEMAQELLQTVDKAWQERVSAQLDAMQYATTGFALAGALIKRYQQYVTLENGCKFTVTVK
jgi:hypothetical protein